MNNILDGLNKDQLSAAKDITGPSFIIAGPGSGKTATIVRRTAYMIQQGIPGNKILLFTFTNKAANELRERVKKFIGDKANAITVGTYHSICCRHLRKYSSYIGYKSNFSIYDDTDKKSLLKDICEKYNIKVNIAKNAISDYKKKFLTPQQAEKQNSENYLAATCAKIYKEYQKALKKNNAMDFDDLVFNFVYILNRYPEVKKEINQKYQYISANSSAA